MSDEARTYAPTPRKLRRARERGDVARSRLLSAALVLAAVCLAIWLGAASFVEAWVATTERLWSTPVEPAAALLELAALWARAVAAPLGCAVVAAVVAGLFQVGPLLAPRALAPDLSRLDPSAGLARLVDAPTVAARLGPFVLAAVVLGLGMTVMYAALAGLLGRVELTAAAALGAAGASLGALAWRACGVLLLAGAVAFAFARWRHHERMRMSRRERAEEARQTAGDPAVLRRRARRRRQLALSPTLEEAAASAAILVEGERVLVAVSWSGAEDNPSVGLVARGPAADALRRLGHRLPRHRDAATAARLATLEPGTGVPRALWPRLAAALARAAA